MNSVGIFIVNAKLARNLKDRQLHFREEKVQLNFKFIVFFYGLANVLLVNSVSTINTAPGKARVEQIFNPRGQVIGKVVLLCYLLTTLVWCMS